MVASATVTRVPLDPTDTSFNPTGKATRKSRMQHPYVAAVVHPQQHLVTIIGAGATEDEASKRGDAHLRERGADPQNLAPGFEIHVKSNTDMKALKATHSASKRNRSANGSDARRKYLAKSDSAAVLNALKDSNLTVDDILRIAKERSTGVASA